MDQFNESSSARKTSTIKLVPEEILVLGEILVQFIQYQEKYQSNESSTRRNISTMNLVLEEILVQ